MEDVNIFRTQNEDYINTLKKRILETSETSESWTYLYNQLYMYDMFMYLTINSTNIVNIGIGSFLPKYIIIVDSIKEEYYNLFFQLEEIGINQKDIRITPQYKSIDFSESILTKYLYKEVSKLVPQKVVLHKINNAEEIKQYLIDNTSIEVIIENDIKQVPYVI